jgi:coatomer protein complex subunit alpha (xenin)
MELKEGDEGSAMRQKAAKVLRASERQGRNALQLDDDEQGEFEVCAASLRPIRGGRPVRCPYCFATYEAETSGQRCVVCNISKVGVETLGLTVWC